ncbi:DUF4407 domain-containing protein [Glaciecola sp. 1036]|uniref:DUF4407 domain-containing protein n=1 Tax=Alteromonadaceae TaxID=72275 RepID=UPI003CFC389A
MRLINKFLYKVAGIDRDTIEKCPTTDKIYARHLGVALCFTFILVFLISFYSFSYVGKGAMEFDVATNSIVNSNLSNTWVMLGAFFIAFVVSTVIILFDRTLFMSDWFTKKPYGINTGFFASLFNKITILFRISIRIAISLTVAYALSIFLELKVYESEIVRKMSDEHLTENQAAYDYLAGYHSDLFNNLDQKKERLQLLQDEYTRLIKSKSGNTLPTQRIEDINTEISRLTSESKAELEQTHANYAAMLAPLYDEQKSLKARMIEVNQNILAAKKRKASEATGKNPEGFNNVSGVKGTGDGYTYWDQDIKSNKAFLNELGLILNPIESRIEELEIEKKTIIDAVLHNTAMAVDSLVAQKNQIYQAFQNKDEADDEQYKRVLTSYDENLKALQTEINAEEVLLDAKYQKEKNRIFSEPTFKPLIDGPLSRLTALNQLKNPENGVVTTESKTIDRFSLLLKSIVVFLEIAPVISKLIFSPPTAYSYKTQGLVIRDVMEEKWQREHSVNVADKESERDVKKRIIEIESEIAMLKYRQKFNNAFEQVSDEEIAKAVNQ